MQLQKTQKGTTAGINRYRPMTITGRDISDYDNSYTTGDNAVNPTPENIPFGGDMPSRLRFVQWNDRRIFSKVDELRLIMHRSRREADVLGVSQRSVEIYEYNLERRDRCTGRGGGVTINIRDSVPYYRR